MPIWQPAAFGPLNGSVASHRLAQPAKPSWGSRAGDPPPRSRGM